MKHAYLITAHKNFKILDLLLELLDDNDNDFYILIDKKLEEIQKLLGIDTIVIPDSVRGSRS